MVYRRFNDAKAFYNVVYPVLLRHEAQNSLPLGNVVLGNGDGEPDGWKNVKNWIMAAVYGGNGEVLLTAIMTPPFNITLYETDNHPNDEALRRLCENFLSEGVVVPGVTSEKGLAGRFVQIYTENAKTRYEVHKHMRVYTLDTVSERVPPIGTMRNAEERDLCFLPYWYNGFHADCAMDGGSFCDAFATAKKDIESGWLYVLEDGQTPVSMAAAMREMVTGRCIGRVYTPPYFRNRGYAGSCVAQLSRRILDEGYRYVSLFTDLANPTSNSIYQKIGYQPVCDYEQISFQRE